MTYLVGAAASLILFFATSKGGNLFAQFKQFNWTTFALGLAIVGLEAGSIYMYRAGWDVSAGQVVHSAILAICLLFVGWLGYHEQLSVTKIIGLVVCMGGLYLINR